MESRIAAAMHLDLEPVALVWSDEKPEGAMEFAPGKWRCVMVLLAAVAKGRTAVVSRDTIGCRGGVVGMVDLSARKKPRRQLGKDRMSFSVPLEMFQRMVRVPQQHRSRS